VKFSFASGCEGFLLYRELTLSPASGCDGGLVVPKLMTRCPTVCCVYISIWPVMGWNVTPLVSGRIQKVVALGLGCLFLVVMSVSINQLLGTMYVWPCMKLCMHFTETLSTTRIRQPRPSAMIFWLLHRLLAATYNLIWSCTCSLLKHCPQPGIDSLGQLQRPFDSSH
jgi:hypothetical protein